MNTSLIIIGDEIMLGQVTDTNSGLIARTLGTAGWEISHIATVGDSREAITAAIDNALRNSDLVITTGGLGPTKDDITKQVLMDFFGGNLIENKEITAFLEDFCARRRFKLNDLTRAQALVPDSCRAIINRHGTAPVMVFEKDGKTLITLPGVPAETAALLPETVMPLLLEKYAADKVIAHRNFLVFGITESDMAEKLAEFEAGLPANLHLAYLPQTGYHCLRLDGFSTDAEALAAEMDTAATRIKEILHTHIFWEEDLSVPEIVFKLLTEKGLTLSTAESCTGGNIARKLTQVAGMSEAYNGTIVSYANSVKTDVLGVDAQNIEAYGAVSLPVVEQMVEGVARVLGTTCAVATSGIAGPGGGTPEKPVGTVCIAVKTPDTTFVDHFFFTGSRASIIEKVSNVALIKLIRLLNR